MPSIFFVFLLKICSQLSGQLEKRQENYQKKIESIQVK